MKNVQTCVVIFDQEGSRLGWLDEDIATTLIAVVSEDPSGWIEMVAYWPRYTSRAVPEFASNLPIEIVARHDAIRSVHEADCWIVLDLIQKRFVSSKTFQSITRDACFAMYTDDKGEQHDPLSVHFAPWWELLEQVDPSEIDQPRLSPINMPFVDREFLFGQPLIDDLAKRILSLAKTNRAKSAFAECVGTISADSSDESNPSFNPLAFYSLTIEVHRDWLMTARDDLGGKCPRQMLHGGHEWLDKVIWGNRIRFDRRGGKVVAVPKDAAGYKTGSIGGEEMAIYFDLCRELIEAGWYWCKNNLAVLWECSPGTGNTETTHLAVEQLAGFLNEVKTDWLASQFEGGSQPAFILECSRRRVPRGSGVEIVGMDQRQSEQHVIDCDCPICEMMADGTFGVGFTGIDGHHLELDNEFAFSKHETLEAWETEQREWAQQSAKWDRERVEREQAEAERQQKIAAGELVEDEFSNGEADEFSSAWSAGVTGTFAKDASEVPIPGDSSGNMRLAFLLAELITELKQNDAENDLIKQLNTDFCAFRTADSELLPSSAQTLTSSLESCTSNHPELTPRIADFQSRIAERLRAPVPDGEDYLDGLPF